MYYRHYEQWGEEVVNEVEEEGLRWSLFTLNADGSWDFWQKTDGCFQKRIRWEMDTEIKIKFSQYILNSYNHTQFWSIMAEAALIWGQFCTKTSESFKSLRFLYYTTQSLIKSLMYIKAAFIWSKIQYKG